MRWAGLAFAVFCSASCLEQAEGAAAVDAGVEVSGLDAGTPDDPCLWSGRNGYCYADMGYVSVDGRCQSVCAPRTTTGKVFRTRDECAATCSCKREKLIAPDSPSDPFVLGGVCDEVWAVVEEPLEDMGCRPGSRVAPASAWECPLQLERPLDLHGLATICAVSAIPQVREVVCLSGAH